MNLLTIWKTEAMLHVLLNLANCSSYSITNYVKIPVFRFLILFIYLFIYLFIFFFEKVDTGHLKMVHVNY